MQLTYTQQGRHYSREQHCRHTNQPRWSAKNHSSFIYRFNWNYEDNRDANRTDFRWSSLSLRVLVRWRRTDAHYRYAVRKFYVYHELCSCQLDIDQRSLDTDGNYMSGMWAVVSSLDGTVLQAGFTPLVFTGNMGQQYSIAMKKNFDGVAFDSWDNGNTRYKDNPLVVSRRHHCIL